MLPVERTTGLGCIPEGCIPEGRTVNYECTVTDTSLPLGFTAWQGSAFTDCPNSSSLLTLPHFRYQPNGVSDHTSCDLSALSVGVSGSNYTSRLTLTATAGLNGRTIECSLSGSVVFGNDTLRTGGE